MVVVIVSVLTGCGDSARRVSLSEARVQVSVVVVIVSVFTGCGDRARRVSLSEAKV